MKTVFIKLKMLVFNNKVALKAFSCWNLIRKEKLKVQV